MTGSLRPEDVVPRLRGRLGREYRFVERCTSTQRLLGEDDPEGAVVVADEQTEGRGRLGRQWLPPARAPLRPRSSSSPAARSIGRSSSSRSSTASSAATTTG